MRSLAVWGAGVMALLSAQGAANAALLSLRLADGPTGDAADVAIGESVTVEIVLTLNEGEAVAFVNLFLDASGGGVLELYDLEHGLDTPPASYTLTGVSPDDLPLPEGLGVPPGGYGLILDTGGVEGPGTFVLEGLLLRGVTAGGVALSFEFGERPPGFFAVDFAPIPVAPPETPPDLPGLVYVGAGDAREGGAGALVITVTGGAPDNTNDNDAAGNDNAPGNDNGNTDDNDGRNTGPRASPKVNLCGVSMIGAMAAIGMVLALWQRSAGPRPPRRR